MKIIIQERATGKTTELIKMSAKTGDTIVCIHWAAVHHTKGLANSLCLQIPEPITFSNLINGNFDKKNTKGFLIDDLNQAIENFSFEVPINAIVINLNKNESILTP